MSWSDLFYPGNPGRRNQVIMLYTKIVTLMESNFKRTNMLIDCLHKHLPGKTFSDIYVDQKKTIRENCDIIIERIEEIQAYLEEKKQKLAEIIEPELYKKLMDTDIKFADKLELARKITSASLGVVGFFAGVTVIVYVGRAQAIVNMASKLRTVAAASGAAVVVAVIFLGIDMIASAIIGAVEKEKLEDAIDKLEETIKVFEPASDDYTMKIERLVIYIEMSTEKGS